MNNPEPAFVILGGTGDLAVKKIVPSLFQLYRKGKVENFSLIGTSRRNLSRKEYIRLLGSEIAESSQWQNFNQNIHFNQLDFYGNRNWRGLREKLNRFGPHRLFYLATLPQHFDEITNQLSKHGLVNEYSKVLYEKPFADNLHSAKELNNFISELFPEEKVFRIDHYLDKELVGNLSILRFSNTIVDPLLNSQSVDQVQIIASENIGVERRGEFYDSYGATKDFLQSHLLQLLSLLGMERPKKLDADCIRDQKVKALKRTKILKHLVGQYKGYKQEKGVSSRSQTDTLVAAEARVRTERWKGVPFYLLSGKKLPRKYSQIFIRFSRPPQFTSPPGTSPLKPNSLVIAIQPDQGIYFTLNTKVPGEMKTEVAKMDFCHSCHHGPNTPSAYENLLSQAIEGDQRSFVRYDEIEQQWRIIDRLTNPKPFIYQPGEVPDQLKEFISSGCWHDLHRETAKN